MAMKATVDINQAAANVNLGVKAITNMKKSVKATMDVMAIRVVEFSNGGYKIRKIFA